MKIRVDMEVSGGTIDAALALIAAAANIDHGLTIEEKENQPIFLHGLRVGRITFEPSEK